MTDTPKAVATPTCTTCEHFLPAMPAEEQCNPNGCGCTGYPDACDINAAPAGVAFPIISCPRWQPHRDREAAHHPVAEHQTASTITDAELDELYDQRDRARRIAVALEQENAELGTASERMRHELEVMYAAAVDKLPTAGEHRGGNAEDCPACTDPNPSYPFLCTPTF